MALTKIGDAGMPSGSVLQVLSTVKTDTFSSTSTSLTDITGLSVAITPSSTSNKILVIVNCAVTGADAGIGFSIVRGSTEIYLGDADGSKSRFSMTGFYASGSPTTYAAGSNQAVQQGLQQTGEMVAGWDASKMTKKQIQAMFPDQLS